MSFSALDARKVRELFPLIGNLRAAYLDTAATSQKPRSVIERVRLFYEEENANVHRGLYPLSERATQRYEGARELVAQFLGARSHEIVFTKNATEALNLLSYCLRMEGKKNIVLTEMEHHANLIPWQQRAKRDGLELRFIKMKDDFTLDLADAKRKIDSETGAVAFVHCSNVLGTINPVKELAALARRRGAVSIVDGAQSAACLEIDVKALGCDFFVCSAHKMFGPTGVGVLFGREALLEQMEPFLTGGEMITRVTYNDAEWAKIPHRFEAGTPHVAGVLGLAEAVLFLRSLDRKGVIAYEKELVAKARELLTSIPGVRVFGPPADACAGIVSFSLDGVHPHDVAAILASEGVLVRGGHHCAMPLMGRLGVLGTVRASFSVYTIPEEVERLAAAVDKARRVLG
ncbi:cysteine desulfurase [Candidatus Woesearchaeota archaeon]|nr:MAG: cysteine desulfurase [Candidatus Woesearchaeota archaeon]